MHHMEHIWTMVMLRICKHTFYAYCREFENWCNLRVLSGKFLRQKSCYLESFCFFFDSVVELFAQSSLELERKEGGRRGGGQKLGFSLKSNTTNQWTNGTTHKGRYFRRFCSMVRLAGKALNLQLKSRVFKNGPSSWGMMSHFLGAKRLADCCPPA